MTFADFRTRIPAINSWLLAGVIACIPVLITPAYVLTGIMLLLWLIEGRLGQKLRALAGEPLVWVFAAYFGVYLLSLAWSDDLDWGWRMVSKQKLFLFLGLYLSVARKEHFARYVSAFLASMAFCEGLAFYNWLDLHVWHALPEGVRVDKNPLDTSPFVDRILYAPALALAGYLAGHRLLFESESIRQRLMYGLLLCTTVLNLVLSGGRAGLLGFAVLMVLLLFQRLRHRRGLAALASLLLVTGVALGSYFGSDFLRGRVDQGVDEIRNFNERPNKSVTLRVVYAMNAWRLFAEQPLLGVGAGDYPVEYARMNALHTPAWKPLWNPHNEYLLAMASAGLLGAVSVLMVLFYPLLRRGPDDGRAYLRVAVPLLFIVLCLLESYLMRSNTKLMYVVFTAILWCDVRGRKA